MGSVRRSGNNSFFFYLGLNIVVSLVTVLAVLSLWDRRRAEPVPTPLPTATVDAAARLASAVPTATETLIPTATPHVYKVKPNDTLFGIALELGVSLTDLMEANDLTETSVLDVGQVLVVPTPGGTRATPTPAAEEVATNTPQTTPEAPQVVIVGVTGVGDLDTEAVQIANNGGGAAMVGWTLEDGQGSVFVFPELTLYHGAIRVDTRPGADTVVDLYWGLDHPLWSSGRSITLRDASGALQSTFTIP
jgi:LysM repeat protein